MTVNRQMKKEQPAHYKCTFYVPKRISFRSKIYAYIRSPAVTFKLADQDGLDLDPTIKKTESEFHRQENPDPDSNYYNPPITLFLNNLHVNLLFTGCFFTGMRIRFLPKTGSGALHFKLREIFKRLLNEYFR